MRETPTIHRTDSLSGIIDSIGCTKQEPKPENLIFELKSLESKYSSSILSLSLTGIHDIVEILTKMNMDLRSILCAVLSSLPYNDVKIKLIDTNVLSKESSAILKHLALFILPAKLKSGEISLSEVVRQLINLGSIEPRILFIKIAFVVARLREAVRTDSENLLHLAGEALKIYAPISHRFGFHQIKSELENTSFRILYSEEYNEIKQYIQEKAYFHEQKIQKITEQLSEKMKGNNISGIVSGRLKANYSIYKKQISKNLSLSNLYDIIAFRVIVERNEDCYQVLSLIQEHFKPLDRFKDYIVNPKPNGYQSLHTTVEDQDGSYFEIQIRDQQMHLHAEMGVSAHWSYKENKSQTEQSIELNWIRRLNDALKKTENPQNIFNLFEGELSTKFIFVFTPNGQIIKLPPNASVVDFAFSIHSEVGTKCTGAHINGKFVTIKTVLRNGDQVEIVTAKNITPSVDWLEFAVTKKARQHIRLSLSEENRKQLREQGLKKFLKILKKMGFKVNRPEDMPLMKLLQKKRRKNSPEELYQSIAAEDISDKDLELLIKQLGQSSPGRTANDSKPPTIPESSEKILNIKDQMFIPIRYAKCCNPQYPAPISGIADGKNMVIHSNECPVINSRAEDEFKKIPLNWEIPTPKKIMNIEIKYSSGLKTTAKIFSLLEKIEDEFVSDTVTKDKKEFRQVLVLKITDDSRYKAFHDKLSKIKGLEISVKTGN